MLNFHRPILNMGNYVNISIPQEKTQVYLKANLTSSCGVMAQALSMYLFKLLSHFPFFLLSWCISAYFCFKDVPFFFLALKDKRRKSLTGWKVPTTWFTSNKKISHKKSAYPPGVQNFDLSCLKIMTLPTWSAPSSGFLRAKKLKGKMYNFTLYAN